MRPTRSRTDGDYAGFVPVHVVWEVTLACNLACCHCGSRAGKRRSNELTTADALEVVEKLAELGTRELSLIGGEAYLRRDWTEIVAAAHRHGMFVSMQTGARALTERRLRAAVDAGLKGLGVSIDGLRETHDRLRGVSGSFDQALRTLHLAANLGLMTSVNTCISRCTLGELESLLMVLAEAGVQHWQVQLTVPMGNAADTEDLILQPYELLELMPLLARLYYKARRHDVLIIPGNNIGYFGPYEHLWRTNVNDRRHYSGCTAGHTALGLESDGTLKGCPSLATEDFGRGDIRSLSVNAIRELAQADDGIRPVVSTWGFCDTCYYRDVCHGGCTWTAHSLFGVGGNNPFCHHRVQTLAARGRRERIIKVADAPDRPFAVGRYALIEEDIADGRHGPVTVEGGARHHPPSPAAPLPGRLAAAGRIPPRLHQCPGCQRFVHGGERTCPFCGGEIAALERRHALERREQRRLMDEVRRLIAEAREQTQ